MSPLASVIAAKRKTGAGTGRIDNVTCWYRFDDIVPDATYGVAAASILRNSFTPQGWGTAVSQVTIRGGPAINVYTANPPPTNPIIHFNGISVPTPTTRKYLGFNPNWGNTGGASSFARVTFPGRTSVKFRMYVKTSPCPNNTYMAFVSGTNDFTAISFQQIYQNKTTGGVFDLLGWTGASENNVWYRIESYFAINSANCFHKVYNTSENLVHTVTYTSTGGGPLTWVTLFPGYFNSGSWGIPGISDVVAIVNPANTDPIGPQR
jgi:hypothetical protein